MTAAALFYLSGAMETEAEPAATDQTTTEQAPTPAPQQTAPAQSPAAPQVPGGATPAQAEQKSDVLPTVSVQASRPRAPAAVRAAPSRPVAAPPPPAQPVATDQSGSGSGSANPALGPTPYQVTNTGITRLSVPLLNMPQTVNVIPQAIIQEQNATTIEQALQYIPGITFSAGEGAQQGDGPIIRGFAARGDLFRDGIRDPGWYTRDAFSIDRIEVYKGPSAFAFGRGATGGAINYVTRLPTGAQYLESTSTVMTGNGYREVVDASGKSGNVSGRIQGLFQDVNTPTRDEIWTKRWGVAPSWSTTSSRAPRRRCTTSIKARKASPTTASPICRNRRSVPRPVCRPIPAITATARPPLRSQFPAPTSWGWRADRSATSPRPTPTSSRKRSSTNSIRT
ncbi:MAG: TonB-dependent receptor plug domain-containing protein [Xanthobacteraceae bacterium]